MKPGHVTLIASLVALLQGCYPEPLANFDLSYASNVAPAEVTFTNLSTDAEEYRWNFGDGETSSSENPTHTYYEGGTFVISLKAIGRGGENTVSKSLTIAYPEPVANFNYSYTDNVAPAEVIFTNLSTDAEEYLWDFGDGNSSTSPNPTHTYYEGGYFIITLRAVGMGGKATASKSINILNPTTYIIRNLSSVTLYSVTSYYWDGAVSHEEVDHGTIYSGGQSAEVITEYDEIYVDFKLVEGGDWYLVVDPYYLTQNMANYLVIDDNTVVYGPVKKKGASVEDHPRLMENAPRMLLKGLMAE
jgi:PKD repeat protein